MYQLKLSFTSIITILSITVTLVTKGNNFSSKTITQCFILLTVSDADQGNKVVIKNDSIELSCMEAFTQVLHHRYVFLASASSSYSSGSSLDTIGLEQYYCAKFLVVAPDSSITVPALDLGDGVKRQYEVAEIICSMLSAE